MSNVLKMAAVGGAAVETDPNFKQTVLLLHGDGTNGAQNNTFLDGSTNNFTITRNGNTTQGTFGPFSLAAGEWSNYFDGSTGYLSVAAQTALGMGAGDFTYEAFIYVNEIIATNALEALFDNRVSSAVGCGIYVSASGYTSKLVYANNTAILGGSTNTIPPFSWTHIAVTRSGTTVRGFINGVLEFTVTDSRTFASSAGTLIGADTGGRFFPSGYISNARIVKGRAVYTSAFTPPTTPLGATSGGQNPPQGTETSLLTCQSNRFIDNSTNAFAITRNGDVRVTPFSPFAPSAAYDPAVNGGSGYFDGTGDYLSIADNAAFELGSSNFAIEAWVYPLALPGNNAIANVASQYITTGSRSFLFALYNNAGTMQLLFQPVSGSTDTAISQNFAFKIGEWAHIAAVRSGNNITLYGNGASLGTTAYSSTINNATGSYLVGARFNSSSVAELLFNGYIAGHRLIVGSDTAPSGIPTAPPTAITNTSLLCNFTNAGIFDNTGKNNLETVGNAQIDTTTKKFGTGSMEFDGTEDYLISPASPEYQFGSGNFTVEAWIYPTVVGGGTLTRQIVGTHGFIGSQDMGWGLGINPSSKLTFYMCLSNSCQVVTETGTRSTNTWIHVAAVRSGTTLTLYVNGVSVGSGTVSTNDTVATRLKIASDEANSLSPTIGNSQVSFNGYIDDLRITKGVARYPTEPFPTKAFPDL